MPLTQLHANSRCKPCKVAARQVRRHADRAKFAKLDGDRRVVRGKVFVCQDVRSTFFTTLPSQRR
jgi:hypothetical protein